MIAKPDNKSILKAQKESYPPVSSIKSIHPDEKTALENHFPVEVFTEALHLSYRRNEEEDEGENKRKPPKALHLLFILKENCFNNSIDNVGKLD